MPPALIHHVYPKDPTLEKKHLSLVCKDHLKDSIEGISAKEQILLDFFFSLHTLYSSSVHNAVRMSK